jgi:large subunit ribosomal protein L18
MKKKKIRNKSELGRIKRHLRIRKRLFGTAEKPRLVVHRSHKNIYAQLIDDIKGETLLSASTNTKSFRQELPKGGNKDAAKRLGVLLAQAAKQKGIRAVVFDRGGYLYHGRVKTFADGAREGGLKF